MYFSEAVSSGLQFFALVPWIVFFPVIGLLINMIFGGRMLKVGDADGEGVTTGEKLVGGLASTAVGLAFVVSVLLAISLRILSFALRHQMLMEISFCKVIHHVCLGIILMAIHVG